MKMKIEKRKYTTEEMLEIYEDIITDYLPYEYIQEVKNSLQYKDFVKELEKQEEDYINKLIEQSELDYNL